ncbi:hypothetical protein [Parablautia muri]|uniref:Uncharacterized protein n=1 Tax=Parablautia muri TaxID=2320879 RepID=A0A9X5BGK3_9FIRM|nr:hypothetical protein [Parablautia muri]NBJ93664.1 hypothetical protein [Parablautia muri]
MIPPLRRISSREQRHQSKQNSSNAASRSFTRTLEEACEKEQQKEIHIQTTGYTKDALPFYHLVSMREYC